MSGRLAATALLALAAFAARGATAAELSLSVEASTLHADMPFVLTLTAKGFEEEPVPDAPALAIDGCTVTFLGVSPNVSSHIQIVNGRRSEWRDVTFGYRWRVVAPAAGRYAIPALRVQQGGTEAQHRAATFEVSAVPATTDMVVRMKLPDRAVWVGETFDVAVEWLLGRDVESYEFAVPLFELDGANVEPGTGGRETVRFAAGARDIELPLERSQISEDGRSYMRFAFPARVTVGSPGTVDLDPIRVVARLATGRSRDAFGFTRPRYELFGASGERRRLTVRPLPVAGRPATFVNAIGTGFALDVQASRTVVSVGEPIELAIRLRGSGPLTGISLPPLSGPEALPAAHFGVPDDSPAGEIDDDGKRFVVTVRVKSAEVREVPPIAFSYFDPAAGSYRTVASQPIALSVGAGQLVGAADVVAAPTVAAAAPTENAALPATAGGIATLLGAQMQISEAAETQDAAWGTEHVDALLGVLYGAPLLAALVSFYLSRTQRRRSRARDIRQALRRVERALAAQAPARETAPTIIAAMRRLADIVDTDAGAAAGLLQQLETKAFDPAAAEEAVADSSRDELRRIARDWARRRSPASAVATAAAVLVGVALLAMPALAAEVDRAQEARTLYQSALAETDRLRRVRLFAQAEATLRPLAEANAAAAELQADWGNAALGAEDPGRAVLGWRRALAAAPGNERARTNLAWLRDRLPAWLPRPASAGALDSLLFWRSRFTGAQLHLIGAGAFAIGVLVLVPWAGRRLPAGRPLATLATVVWITATASALLSGEDGDAVVMLDGATLRSADSTGASPAFANPLPAGTEVTVLETRDRWHRVTLADGTRGWLASSAIELVAP